MSEIVANIKAQNALLPLYRKELRKLLLEYLQSMWAMKKDYTFQKVIETQKDLKDTEGFDWLELTELAIDMLNQLFVKQPMPQGEDYTYFDCCVFALNTNVFQTNIQWVVLLELISFLLRGL